MANRSCLKRNRNIFVSLVTSCLLLIFLSLPLSACGVTLFSLNCTGISVSCSTPSPTPNRPALLATAQAISQSKPLMSDPLSRPDNNGWRVYVNAQRSCSFHDGAYFITNNDDRAGAFGCDSTRLSYKDAAIQVDITLISGDAAGIIFRVDPTFSEMYSFEITRYGEADIRLFGKNGSTSILVPARADKAIHRAGKKNTLLAIAKGNDLQIFVNGAFIGETQDDALTTGFLGMNATNYSENAKASFSHLVIYPV